MKRIIVSHTNIVGLILFSLILDGLSMVTGIDLFLRVSILIGCMLPGFVLLPLFPEQERRGVLGVAIAILVSFIVTVPLFSAYLLIGLPLSPIIESAMTLTLNVLALWFMDRRPPVRLV